jgi:GNAT superfamily N-acetyltransferase
MIESYSLTLTDQPTPQDRHIVDAGLAAFNAMFVAPEHYVPLCVFVRSAQGIIVGGLLGETNWGWLHVTNLWLREDVRGGGLGTKVLQLAEEEARQRNCQNAFLDTVGLQSLGFYLKRGYSLFGQLDDFPQGKRRYFLKKTL